MSKSKAFLQKNFSNESELFGVKDDYINQVVSNWHYHKDYSARWKEVETFNDHKGKILDMACGVGTFMFHGLDKKYDIYGIEPEKWKLDYIHMKIDEMSYPQEWKNRFIEGIGENLPFEDNTFDFVITYQTLEHVKDVEQCINEMLRVLKVGGRMKIQCPDYNSFFEPHYRLPFLPRMNKNLARFYLKILGRPTTGLNHLNWTTNDSIMNILYKYNNLEILNLSEIHKKRRIDSFKSKFKLPTFISRLIVNLKYYRKVYLFQQEKHVNIILKKVG